MMRAALILVGRWLLVAMEGRDAAARCKAVDQPLTQSTVGAGDPRDTLAKADRLEIPYFQKQLSTRLISFAEPMPPADSTSVISKEAGQIVGGNRHDARATPSPMPTATPRPRRSLPYIPSQAQDPRFQTKAKVRPETRPRPRFQDRREYKRAKPPMDAKPCRPNASITSSKH